MGSFNFIPLPNAIPTAVKTSNGAKIEGSAAKVEGTSPKLDGQSFQTLLAQASGKLESNPQHVHIQFEDLPEELQEIIQGKFGIQNADDIELIQLPKNAVRVDENGELRISIEEVGDALNDKINPKESGEFIFHDLKNTHDVKNTVIDEEDGKSKVQRIKNEQTEEQDVPVGLIKAINTDGKFSTDEKILPEENSKVKQEGTDEKPSVLTFNNVNAGQSNRDESQPSNQSKSQPLLNNETTETKNEHVKNEHVKNEHVENDYVENDYVENEHVENEHVENEHVENEHVENDYVENELKAEKTTSDTVIAAKYTKEQPHFVQDQNANELGSESKVTYLFDPEKNTSETTVNQKDAPVDADQEAKTVLPKLGQDAQPKLTDILDFTSKTNKEPEQDTKSLSTQETKTDADTNTLKNQTAENKSDQAVIQSHSSPVIYFKPTLEEVPREETKVSSLVLNNTLEVTDAMAKAIAEIEQKHSKNKEQSDTKNEFVIVKSPVQQTDNDQKPVLFLVNTKDIKADIDQPGKQAVFKSEAAAEKLAAMNGQIKVQFANPNHNNSSNSSTNGEQQDTPHDKKAKQNAVESKLPMLSESGLQLSRKINEQPAVKTDAATQENFKAAIKASTDQTALETKTAAQPTEVRVKPEVSSSSNTTNTTTVSTAQESSGSSSTQQTTNTQTAAKPGAPAEIPQAYKDAATQQIVKSVQSSFGSERSHVSIRLNPESLGRVDIQLKMENGMMTAHIVAEKESTQAMLEKNSSALKSALDEKNIQIDKVVFSKDSSENRQPHQEQNKSSDRWREYQQDQHKEQNQSRREQQNQQQDQQQDQPQSQKNTWQNITSYMDRFFQRNQA